MECCVNKRKCKNCDFNKYDTCFVVREKEILDLINRKKAEIERFRYEQRNFGDIGKLYSEIKADVYNEVAKKFEKCIKDVQFTLGQTWEIQSAWDKTLTELTERKEDEE